MQQVIQCPKCAQRYQAAPEWAGKTTNCPGCGTLIQIPRAPQLTPAPLPPLEPVSAFGNALPAKPQPAYAQPPGYLQQQPSGSMHPLVWAAIGGGVIAVFFVFTLVVYAWGRSSAARPTIAQAADQTPAGNFPPASPPATSNPRSSNTLRPKPLDNLPPKPLMPPVVIPPAPALAPTPSDAPATKPAVPTAPADWGNQPEPKPTPSNPSTKSPAARPPAAEFGSQVIVDSGGIVFGAAGCPVAVTGSQVWDIDAKKIRAELVGRTDTYAQAALSPDGNWFAAAGQSTPQRKTEVIVWDTRTGEQRFSTERHSARWCNLHLSDKLLFLGERWDPSFEVWDLETGFQGKTIEIEGSRLSKGSFGFTLDGNYVATVVKDKLTVFRTSTGKMAAYMGTPKRDGPFSSLSGLQSVQFSADSLELAAVASRPPHVLCWDNRGKLIFDQPFPIAAEGFRENALQWFPNRQAWLIERDIFDRTTGKVVLSIRKPWSQELYIHVHDDDHLVGTFPSNPTQLEVLEIPWEKIRAAQAAMKTKEAALLSPSLPVSLLIELGDLRGDQAEVTQLIDNAFRDRLKRDGFTVAPGGKSYFRIKFAETAGDQLPIFERQRFAWGAGRDTGRTVAESKGDLVVELFVFGRVDAIWRDTLKITSSRSFNDEINDTTVRKSMLDRAAMEIRRLNFPYFIPESEEMIALPIVVQ